MIVKILKRLFIILVLLFLYLPILILAVYSFTSSTQIGAIRGFSLKNYVTLVTTPELTGMIAGTISLAVAAALIATVLGTMGALGAFYSGRKMSSMITTLNQIPVINADVVTGFSICILLVVAFHISKDSYIPLLAGHVTLCAPFVFLSVMPRITQMDPSIYEAALDLGATPGQALRMVMLPELWPGMLSGFILALTLSVDDFGVTFFTKGSGGLETLSTFIYSDARKGGLTPELRPLFTIILLVMLAMLVYINFRDRKEED